MSPSTTNYTTTETIESVDVTPAEHLLVRRWNLRWRNIILGAIAHAIALYGIYLIASGNVDIRTVLFTYAAHCYAMLGIFGGTHRLWAHRSYEANFGLQLFLMLGATLANQYSVIHWAHEHRCHHKFSETDADHVNASRGLFFSHIGWLLVEQHPDVARKGRTVDKSDLEQNALLAFNDRYYVPLGLVVVLFVPLLVPSVLWNETWTAAFCVAVVLRWIISLHSTFLINSVAHHYGHRPYDASISPTEKLAVSLTNGGEGFHNYHHAFPVDYRAAELGGSNAFTNPTGAFIEWCASNGWAWNLKTTSAAVVEQRALRKGDGTRIGGVSLAEKDR